MKPSLKKITLSLATGGFVLMTAWAQPYSSQTYSSSQPYSSIVAAIQQAPDPSGAVQAFANGISVHPNDPKILEAYVTRMAQLGTPQMAYEQAVSLTSLEPRFGLAWAVVADSDLRRGMYSQSIDAINQAVALWPNDIFVQRTAGEVVAWYDVKGSQVALNQETRVRLEKVRTSMGSQTEYQQSYNLASNAFQSQPDQYQSQTQEVVPETQPAPQAQQVVPGEVGVLNGVNIGTAPTYEAEPTYTAPDYAYTYPQYSYYAGSYPYYDYGYYGPNWWWGPSVGIGIGWFPNFGYYHHGYYGGHPYYRGNYSHGYYGGHTYTRGGYHGYSGGRWSGGGMSHGGGSWHGGGGSHGGGRR